MNTPKLLGVSTKVVDALYDMPHRDYLEIGITLMNRLQVKGVKEYNEADFKYRAKAIKNYEKWLKDPMNGGAHE